MRSAVQTAALAQRYFAEGDDDHPPVVEQMWNLFNHEQTGPSVKLRIARFFMEVSMQQAVVMHAFGLVKNAPTQPAQSMVHEQLRPDLPFEERLRRIEADVARVPRIGASETGSA